MRARLVVWWPWRSAQARFIPSMPRPYCSQLAVMGEHGALPATLSLVWVMACRLLTVAVFLCKIWRCTSFTQQGCTRLVFCSAKRHAAKEDAFLTAKANISWLVICET